jgi:hypothetical protein
MISFEDFFEQSNVFESVNVRDDRVIVRLLPERVDELYEMTAREIKNASTIFYKDDHPKKGKDKMNDRSKLVKYKFIKLKEDGLLIFNTNSVTGGGENPKRVKYVQHIKLLEFNEAVSGNEGEKPIDKIRLAMYGDIEVRCNCKSFKYYGFEYIANELGYLHGPAKNIKPDGDITPPVKRNPDMEGTVCKHLLAIFKRWDAQVGPVTGAFNSQQSKRKPDRKPEEEPEVEPEEEPREEPENSEEEPEN